MGQIFSRRNPAALIVFGYVALVAVHLACGTFLGFERNREARGFALQHVLRMGRPLLKDGRTRELAKYLADAQSTGLVDYFELTERGHADSVGTVPPTRAALTDPVSEQGGWAWGHAESAEVALRLASGYGYAFRFRATLGEELARLPADLAFVLLACALALGLPVPAGVAQTERRETRRVKVTRQEAPKKSTCVGDFTGICGRAALLNQSELAGAGDPGPFFASLDDFYADASAVIERYGGRVQGVYGHELLFYFTGNDPARERGLARAAARDLGRLAELRGFRFGAALAEGRLHGAELAAGAALLGAPVEETAELLVRLGVGIHGAKGVEAATFGDALGAARGGDTSALAFHRGDEALTELLRSLTAAEWGRESYVKVVGDLRQVVFRRCGSAVVEAYRGLLSGELARKDSYRLSSVIALAASLLNRAQLDRAFEKSFLQAAAVKDRRVRANAVELFTTFFPEREVPELRPLIRDEDNRVSANALIKAACERFDEKVIARIDERVRGGSVAHVASALHAMGEIAQYYRKHDPLFLGTKVSFLRLFESVTVLATHPNSMIRRQALFAAKKLGSEPIDARLREVFVSSADPELVDLFARVYGWQREASPEAA